MAIQVVRCKLSDYAAAIRTIRKTVFVVEQGVPIELEMDDRDPFCNHILALVDGHPGGTARLDITAPSMVGKIGRLAVLPRFRGQGLGRLIMQEIETIGYEHHLPHLWCHAQKTAVSFYKTLGYKITGPDFTEAGIEHCKMQKTLKL
ncbi:MAG: GNAT family N-acetyltransferase [Leptolyngbya sp. SIO3F4]|nr:GNAT family N-acetyltransferase [Leptolyngbya sp. SIO3F4]